ncbi:unnamed protein product [Bursaphelenchus okinawaensis]|uniref:Uncharacterized protein n=1 Tax=Bursaphelenchus okinawaensis TaxID=465554 RepID=A0A811LAD5_9BILA|nr:unnamed protein product [Bursaphelenchus okinawaensis]CAG9119968.1 unnamed protein product [Bursaphelenchus okinawaensis]
MLAKQLSHDDMKAFTFDCNLGENEEEPKKFLAVACKYDVVYNYHDQKLHFLEPHGRKGMALTELVPSKFFSECRRLSTVWNEANGMWPSFTCRMLVTRELFGKSKAELEAHLLGMLNSVRALAIEPNVPEMLLSSGGKFKISCLNRSMTPEEQLDTVTIVSRLLCYFAYDMESFDLTQLGIYNSDQHRYSLINSRASEAVHYTCNQERWNAKEWLEGCSCRMSAAFKNKHLHNVCCCSVIAFHDYMFAYSTAIFSALPNY